MRNFLMNVLRGFIALMLVLLLAPLAFAQSEVACHSAFAPAITLNQTAPGKYNPLTYYADKMRELKELDSSAPYAVALRGLIMSTTKEVKKELIPLSQLKPIHPITRGAALEKLDKRTKALQTLPQAADTHIHLDENTLNSIMPSKNSMRAIRADNGDAVVFDGNGRLVAIQQAFAEKQQDVMVEVEMHYSKSKLLQKTLKKVRQMRNVLY
ncbi:MAG: hypothetical protein JSU04_12150 [Bdellovibrionales bacterium]|nr:hypothetical protein [Bdellovibrionales bacterium]